MGSSSATSDSLPTSSPDREDFLPWWSIFEDEEIQELLEEFTEEAEDEQVSEMTEEVDPRDVQDVARLQQMVEDARGERDGKRVLMREGPPDLDNCSSYEIFKMKLTLWEAGSSLNDKQKAVFDHALSVMRLFCFSLYFSYFFCLSTILLVMSPRVVSTSLTSLLMFPCSAATVVAQALSWSSYLCRREVRGPWSSLERMSPVSPPACSTG